MDKRTKILATLGPASHEIEIIEGLIKAGANMFRLNFSHGSHEYHLETLNNIRTAMKNVGKTVGILQDISGPKVRIGDVKDTFNDIYSLIINKESSIYVNLFILINGARWWRFYGISFCRFYGIPNNF